MFSGALLAQDFEYHPALSDNFTLMLGAFDSDNSFKISADDRIEGQIDFIDKLGVDGRSTLFNGQLRWKFGKDRKWSIWGQYFENSSSGEAVLTEDIDWQDVTFRQGSFVGAGVKMAVTRVDWISANIGDYKGTLWNTSVGVNFQAFRHVGFDLSYQYFNLNLSVNKTDWRGDVDLTYSGPVLV